ncbi:MAG: type II secretion system protein [Chloroflexi bacterium]|nr:type II secretion system protein [Chloroflexota bacterium]
MTGAVGSRLSRVRDRASRGFTLVELLVSLSILGISMGLIGSGIFRAFGLERTWSDDVVATREVRHATSWFAGDAPNAQQTDLADGAAPVSSATLSWTGQGEVSHVAAYSLSLDATLIREFDGATITVARRVLSAHFSRQGSVLKLALEVQAAAGETEQKSVEVYGRTLQ